MVINTNSMISESKAGGALLERTARSAELDTATGMYYYGARYYDPRLSIFISVDPLAEQTFEPYSYVGNNPIMFIDPTGTYKVKPADQKRFSVLTGYLKNGVNEILNNPKIMDGLRKYGRFTDEQIKIVLLHLVKELILILKMKCL